MTTCRNESYQSCAKPHKEASQQPLTRGRRIRLMASGSKLGPGEPERPLRELLLTLLILPNAGKYLQPACPGIQQAFEFADLSVTAAPRHPRHAQPAGNVAPRDPALPYRGTCCVMQWMLPPPNRISRAGTPTTCRPGNARFSRAAASRSVFLSSKGMTMPRLAM